MAAGTLYLIPSWISVEGNLGDTLPAGTLERIRTLGTFVVEDARSARRFLSACGHPKPLREIAMRELNEHTALSEVDALLAPLHEGHDVGLLSEAGAPAVADPGAALVAAAHASGVVVRPLGGPSSIVLALMASGLEGQRFRFLGYLPADSAGRRVRLAEVEKQSARLAETQVFIETPYRNDALLADILATCRAGTRLAVAAELSSPHEWIRMDRIEGWRAKPATIGKRPAVFLLLAQ